MTNNDFLYCEDSYYLDNDKNKSSVRNRMIPISQIKRMWDFTGGFGIAQDGYVDIYVPEKTKNESLIDFYKRAYVSTPTQPTIDNTIE